MPTQEVLDVENNPIAVSQSDEQSFSWVKELSKELNRSKFMTGVVFGTGVSLGVFMANEISVNNQNDAITLPIAAFMGGASMLGIVFGSNVLYKSLQERDVLNR